MGGGGLARHIKQADFKMKMLHGGLYLVMDNAEKCWNLTVLFSDVLINNCGGYLRKRFLNQVKS
jgi:hypothetical protein